MWNSNILSKFPQNNSPQEGFLCVHTSDNGVVPGAIGSKPIMISPRDAFIDLPLTWSIYWTQKKKEKNFVRNSTTES